MREARPTQNVAIAAVMASPTAGAAGRVAACSQGRGVRQHRKKAHICTAQAGLGTAVSAPTSGRRPDVFLLPIYGCISVRSIFGPFGPQLCSLEVAGDVYVARADRTYLRKQQQQYSRLLHQDQLLQKVWLTVQV